MLIVAGWLHCGRRMTATTTTTSLPRFQIRYLAVKDTTRGESNTWVAHHYLPPTLDEAQRIGRQLEHDKVAFAFTVVSLFPASPKE